MKTQLALLLHTGNEGTHAITDVFRAFSCVSVSQNEWFDNYLHRDLNSSELETWQFNNLQVYVRNVTRHIDFADCSCLTIIVLIRTTIQNVCRLNALPLMAIRSDIMRFTLANVDWGNGTHPQFFANFTTTKREYNSSILNKAFWRAKAHWIIDERMQRELHMCNKTPIIMQYEAFDDDFTHAEHRYVLSKTCPGNEYTYNPVEASVHRAHSYQISEFVENPLDVYSFFAQRNVPSVWSEMANIELPFINGINITVKTKEALLPPYLPSPLQPPYLPSPLQQPSLLQSLQSQSPIVSGVFYSICLIISIFVNIVFIFNRFCRKHPIAIDNEESETALVSTM
jgi:hypothetical protein